MRGVLTEQVSSILDAAETGALPWAARRLFINAFELNDTTDSIFYLGGISITESNLMGSRDLESVYTYEGAETDEGRELSIYDAKLRKVMCLRWIKPFEPEETERKDRK